MNSFITIAMVCVVGTAIAQGRFCGSESAKVANANSNATASQVTDKLKTGTWGGDHVRAEVSETGVEFEFDCANGKIAQAVMLDGRGRFDLTGTFATEHAGPVRRDESGNARSVRYSGTVKDGQMTLTITDTNKKEEIGTFALTHGKDVPLRKCR